MAAGVWSCLHIELAVWKQRVNKKRGSPRSGSLLPARLHLQKVQQPSHLPLQLGSSVLMQSLRETSHLSQECKFSSTDFPACLGCGSSSSSSSGAKRIQCNEIILDFLLLLRSPWLFHTDVQENINTHKWDPSTLPAALSQLHCTDPSGSQSGAAPMNLDAEKLTLIRLPLLHLKSS